MLRATEGGVTKHEARAYQLTRMPALPPMPSTSSPKMTSSLANTAVEAEGLKKFTPAETSPQMSSRSSSRRKVLPLEPFALAVELARR